MKKTVSFCLYGTDLKYYTGAEKNILINKELLPEWDTDIYYSPVNILDGYVTKLSELGANMINVTEIPIHSKINYPMFWRYLSFTKNNTTIVRDLDSRISKREVENINRWLDEGTNYFIIRDHPWHSLVPGGLFGVRNPHDSVFEFFEDFITNNLQGWGTDQDMLSSFMSKIEKTDVTYFGFDKHENYIPRDDENFFIGIQLDENDNPINPSATLALDYLKQLGL